MELHCRPTATKTQKTSKRTLLWTLAAVAALATTATAEISFTTPATNGLSYRPGDLVTLTWTIDPAPAVNTQNFDLSLRALSTQRYNIQTNVAQNLLTLEVRIPANVTGGLHSFYAFYRGGAVPPLKSNASTRQFHIPLPIVNPTTPASDAPATRTGTAPDATGTAPAAGGGSGGGMSPVVLGGIIAGVIVVLMAVAMVFLGRHKRRVAEGRKDGTSRSMDGKGGKEGAGGGGGHQDKESLTKSAGSAGGFPDNRSEGQEAVPLKLNRPPMDGSPRSQHKQHQNQHQQHNQQRPPSPTATRNPFEAPEMMIHPNSPTHGGASPRQQNQNHHQYQPPQLPPPQHSPFGTPPQQYSGMPPNPLMSNNNQHPDQQRTQSPYHQGNSNNRDSFESELESAYDPHPHGRMMTPPIHRNNSNNGGPASPSPLGHSPSGAQDREILAVAAAVAAAASPVPAHRQPPNQQQQNQQKAAPSPRMKEIEMQQFDVQQHHQEQQQKMMQRQQQQQQPPQPSWSAQSTPMPAAQKSMNPTQFDDKTEFEDSDTSDSDDENPFRKPQNQQQNQQQQQQQFVPPPPPSAPAAAPAPPATQQSTIAPPPPPPAAPVIEDGPAYNGYRDTIFGAYANTQGDDDDEDDDEIIAVPALPSTTIASPLVGPTTAATTATTYQPSTGGAEIVRKKSVKFTGVPKSGPIVLPSHEAAKEHQQQRQQIKQQQQFQQQEEDSDEFYSQDDEDIRARMLETAGQSMTSPSESNAPASFRPTVSTSTNGNAPGNSGDNVLSPIRSPGQQQYSNNPYQLGEDEDSTDDEDNMHDDDPYGAYGDMPPPPQAPFKQQQPGVEESPRLNAVVSPTSDDDFFGDVLAAVEKTAVPPPPTSSSSSHSQFNPDSYTKPQLPPMPADNNPAPAPPPAQYTHNLNT
ncbi:hypothetical protein BGX24_011702 [Mortierella sp. AD032]|nr:hypothetical protein BGX24_011702 [Mortierella sp. AD032]